MMIKNIDDGLMTPRIFSVTKIVHLWRNTYISAQGVIKVRQKPLFWCPNTGTLQTMLYII